eukprot:TRINITY_DN16967_c0_g1_i2.p1 TRINITY_DN16967_c0_g1~~TRINITY_DN16967_c0_g1_i2.p1  ORF type:complete len:498 (-),score=79.62 TRINITY_DN16967_c0_g1_i2:32-1504(-)
MTDVIRQSAAPAASPQQMQPPAAFLKFWKSRLPVIVVPVLASLRALPWQQGAASDLPAGGGGRMLQAGGSWEPLLLIALALATGFWRLPFSITWWLVILAAFALHTELLVGVATVLSLTVLLGWYGVRLRHPQAVSALWGGARGAVSASGAEAAGTCASGAYHACMPGSQTAWQIWDIFVHGGPALLVLFYQWRTVTAQAAALAMPLNVLWLWGLGLGKSLRQTSASRGQPGRPLRRPPLWPLAGCLSDTDVAYRVEPKLPEEAWLWIYGSHWAACAIWFIALAFPAAAAKEGGTLMQEFLFAYGVFLFWGVLRVPYTQAWWTLFLASLYGRHTGRSFPFLEAVTWCCGITTSVGFYGTQMLIPGVFRSLIEVWLFRPVDKWAPTSFSSWLRRLGCSNSFWMFARVCDLFVHLVPTATAAVVFRPNALAALASLPTNLLWLVASGCRSLPETNKHYGVEPEPPRYLWTFIYGGHWSFCGAMFCLLGTTGW